MVRPDLALLWPSFTFFPLAALGVLFFGSLGRDPVMIAIGVLLLAINIAIVANQAYFTTLGVEDDELVYRTNFGLKVERVPLGSLQRVDAKRYPGAHSGVSAPFFVARGRDTTVRVNTKPYRLKHFVPLLERLAHANPRLQLDEFWAAVAAGKDISKEVGAIPRSRM